MINSIYKKILASFLVVSIIPLFVGIIAIFSYFQNEKTKELSKIMANQLSIRIESFLNLIKHEENNIKKIIELSSYSNDIKIETFLKFLIFKSKLVKEADIIDKNGSLILGESYIDFLFPGKKIKIPKTKYSIEFSHNLYFLKIKENLNREKILILKISLKNLIENYFISQSNIYKYFITDSKGKLLYHSNYLYVLTMKKINLLSFNKINEIFFKSKIPKESTTCFAYVRNIPELNLNFGISIDKKVALKEIYSFLYRGISIIAIIIILSIVISFILSKKLSTPIKDLEIATKNIRKGNYIIKIPKKLPKDEIGELYANFELMVKTISRLITEKEIQLNKLNLLFDTINDSIYVINSNYEIVLINRNELEYINNELSETIGKKCYKVFANRESICPNCLIEKVKKDKKIHALNNINLVKEGFRQECKREYVNMTFYPFGKDEFLIYIKDLTTIYKILNEVEFEREKLFVTLHSIGDGVIVVDKDKNIILINNPAKEILKIDNIKENTQINIIFSEIEKYLNEAFKLKKQINIKETKIIKNNDEIIVEDSISPIFIKDKLEGAVIVFRDITEKKKLEEEIIKKEKLEAVGMLAAGIAHDFNNILTAALGNISLCELYIENKEKLIEKLKSTEQSLYNAKNLTEKLLTFSKGGYLIKETSDIKKIIKESVDFILSGKDIKVKYEFPDDLWLVKGDSSQLVQVFHNLAINSVEAIEKNGLIEISTKNITISEDSILPLPPGNYVMITFKDNGKGIPQEILHKIFDPFFSTKKEGSGLGLATVYNIIKKHNGYIKVDSLVGKGTMFFIYLPAETTQKPKEIKKDETKETKNKKRTILIMDDNDELRETVKELLELLGNKVYTATKGEEAIEIYKNNKIDLAILDLTIIGGMGGKETIKELLKIDKNVKAIVSSGYSDDDAMANYKEYGFIGKIEKPYTIAKLKKLLEEIS